MSGVPVLWPYRTGDLSTSPGFNLPVGGASRSAF